MAEVLVAELSMQRGVGVAGSIPVGAVAVLSLCRICLQNFPPSAPCDSQPASLVPHIW